MFASFSFFGFLDIYLLPIFLGLGAFFGTFVFYRLLHHNARYSEYEIFDGFLLATLAGFVISRLFFIALHLPHFRLQFWRWLNFISYPGLALFAALIGSSFIFYFFLRRHKIPDLVELLDYWARAACLGLVFYYLGLFFDGSGVGYLTTSPLGLVFPGVSARTYPAQLYACCYFLLVFFLLGYLEQNYRTFAWYRGSRSQARAGFVCYSFFALFGLYGLLSLGFQPPAFFYQQFSLDWLIYLTILIWSVAAIAYQAFSRSRPKKKPKKSTKRH